MREYLSWISMGVLAAGAVGMAGAAARGAEEAPVLHEEEMAVLIAQTQDAETRPAERQPGTQPAETQPATRAATTQAGEPEKKKRGRVDEDTVRGAELVTTTTGPSTQPSTQLSTQPSPQPSMQPFGQATARASTQPATQPTTRPSSQSSTQPGTQPTTRSSTQPSTRPATTQAKALLPMAPVRAAWDHYQVIYQRNMFMAQRSGGSIFGSEGQVPRGQENRTPTVTAAPRILWVLTGVALLDDDKMAFAENMSTGQTTRARVGDRLGDGKVTSITAEGVEMEVDGKASKVGVGAALDGRSVDGVLSSGAVPVVQPDAPGGGGTSGASGTTGTAGAGSTPQGTSDEAAIRERLKRRRQEQGGK